MSEPTIHAADTMPEGAGRTILLVVAHADDPALSLGGTLLRWSDAGWRIVCVRVTDDRWDSVGMTEAATIAANREEFEGACRALGVAETVELGYCTDVLGDVSEVELRQHMIRLVRTHRPYALVTFDPYAMYGEDNQDHIKLAAAVDESFWTSQFDLHHPEHLAAGLLPHGVFERWYFGRSVMRVTDVIDIAAVLDRKIAAVLCHLTPLRNIANQLRMQARTGGWAVPMLDDAATGGDLRPLVEFLLRQRAAATGAPYRLAAAEQFRVVRFGGLQALLDRFGQRL
jgi:LmbE family N-acetylglucosaminyl deacetylase